ncbi:GAF domain-containing protein [Nocardia sp. NBC_00511]|uniref:GAF domain-containing protein n=1 Tax=Nocardia sp. NBC_00511 TaxID=2903591 RepID=UPI0030DF87D2
MPDTPQPNPTGESRLLDAFAQMADVLVDDYDTADVLHVLVTQCVLLLDTAAAGILMADQHGGMQMLASSNEQAATLELYQLQAHEGPCWDTVRCGEPVFVADLGTTADRWPRFVPRALAAGFVSVHTIPLRLRQEVIGALNIFGREPKALSERDIQAATALADIATIGILQERAIGRSVELTDQLQRALVNRVTIEQAKGILAQAGNLDMNQAFQALRAYGRRRSTRLTDVAYQLTTGAIWPDTILTDNNYSDSQ